MSDSDGYEAQCSKCKEDIFMAIDPEDGKWKPYEDEFSDDLHVCQKPKAKDLFQPLD